MLSNRFKEGNQLAFSSVVEIPLPDDDPDSMQTMCNIIHMRHHAVPALLSPEHIVKLAECCDKYDCATATKPSIEAWTLALLQTATDSVRGQLLTAACLVRNPTLVNRIAIDLVLNARFSICEISTLGSVIPPHLPAAIDRHYYDVRLDIAKFIEAMIGSQVAGSEPSFNCARHCKRGVIRTTRLIQQLQPYGLFPSVTSGRSVGELFNAMENIRLKDPANIKPCTAASACRYSGLTLEGRDYLYEQAADTIRRQAETLDLFNVRESGAIIGKR